MFTRALYLVLLAALFITCTETETLDETMPLPQQVDQLIKQNEYETALTLLEDKDKNDPEIQFLLEKTHLNYGYHSMNTFDEQEMRTRMNNALVQFTEVLRINPDNSAAREQIDQIMAVYATMPDRGPREEVLEGLREVGLNY